MRYLYTMKGHDETVMGVTSIATCPPTHDAWGTLCKVPDFLRVKQPLQLGRQSIEDVIVV
jgi:hypothetical protein